MRFVQIFRNFLDEQAEVIRWQFLQLIRLKTFEELIVAILPGFFEFLVSFESVQVIGHGVKEEPYFIRKYFPNLVVGQSVHFFLSEARKVYLNLNPADGDSGSMDFEPRLSEVFSES
jgi:hypothetical protein